MREIIDKYAAMNDDGDILPLVDVYTGLEDEELDGIVEAVERNKSIIYHQKEEELRRQRDDAIDNARSARSFRNRNYALAKVARNAGRSNQDWGAAQLSAMGSGDHIKGADTAAERSLRREGQARHMAELACRVCPLQEFCPQEDSRKLVIDTMMQMGPNGQNARGRFTDRLSGGKSGDFSKNNHFCETNVRADRLKKNEV